MTIECQLPRGTSHSFHPDNLIIDRGSERLVAAPDSLPIVRAPVTSTGTATERLKIRLDERDFMRLVEVNLVDALAAPREYLGACTRCKAKNVPVIVPDWTARTKALEALWDRGYGKPAQTITVEQDTLHGLGQLRAWLELMTDEERGVLSQFIDRVTSPQGTP